MRLAALLLSTVFVLPGCGPSTDESSAESAAPGDSTEVTELSAPAGTCTPVSPQKLAQLSSGLNAVGGPLALRQAYAVDADTAWTIIAAEVDGPGREGDGEIGTWAVATLEPRGAVYAADEVSNEISRWSDFASNDAADLATGTAATEARQCVEDAG